MAHQLPRIQYYEQLPPQHNLAEEILLGGIILNSNIIELVIGELIIESFALERHRLIYKTIVEIYIEKQHINAIILINQLWELNLLEQIGGINKILQLLQQAQIFTSKIITSTAIRYYILLIQDKYLRRQLIQYGYNIINLAYDASLDSLTLAFKLDRYIARLKKQLFKEKDLDNNSFVNKVLLNLKSPYSKNDTSGLYSHFYSLDQLTGGFQKGDLIVIAGRPSMGKTSLSLNIGLNIVEAEAKGFIFFSLEMSKTQILYKLLSMKSKISTSNIQKGKIQQGEWVKLQQAGNLLAEAKINIDDTANLSITDINIKAKNICDADAKVNLLIIDYLQLIQIRDNSFSTRTEELSEITRSLKMLAKSMNIPIIVLSQLNRNVESRIIKRPLLADLRESGCLFGRTNIVQFISYKKICSYSNLAYLFKETHSANQVINVKKVHVIYNQTQYLYQLIKQKNNSSVQLTHNHSVFTHFGWCRVDNFKYFTFVIDLSFYSAIFQCSYITKHIYLLAKDNSYDMSIQNEKIFFSNDYLFTHNSIEQDADLVLLLFRESYYNCQEQDDLTEVIVAKHRNGPIGISKLNFQPDVSIFNE